MSQPDKYTCKEAFERLDDYLDRELTVEEVALLEAHLCECVQCAGVYKFEGSALDCLKQKLAHISLPQGLLERVSKALDDCESE